MNSLARAATCSMSCVMSDRERMEQETIDEGDGRKEVAGPRPSPLSQPLIANLPSSFEEALSVLDGSRVVAWGAPRTRRGHLLVAREWPRGADPKKPSRSLDTFPSWRGKQQRNVSPGQTARGKLVR